MTRKQLFKFGCCSIALLAVTVLCIIGFWRPGTFLKTFNQGHRLGADVISDYPENSLPLFRLAVAELEQNDGYLYSECDLRETKDHEVVVFHDWDLDRMVPDTAENREALGVEKIGGQLIKDLTLAQIKAIRLVGGHRIPTLEEVLECAAELRLQKPLLLEIKYFHCDIGRQHALNLAKKYRDQTGMEIHFSSFRRNIGRSYPEPKIWLDKFAVAGFRVYQVYRPKSKSYDLCENW